MSEENPTDESESVSKDVANEDGDDASNGLERILDVKVRVSVELGRRRMPIAEVLELGPGSLIEFPKPADEPLDIFVNEQLVARGEAVVMGERYGVRVTQVVSPHERLRSSGLVKEEMT